MRETVLAMVMMTACAVHAVGAGEQDLPDLVVTPTGQAVSALQLGHSITTVTAQDIAANGWRTLPEALRVIPGLHINESGAPGSTVGLVMRGSRSSQVLVLVDGMRLNDPSGPTREAEIASIDLANIERIEVLRGPQSGLYGSDAIAGVINIITRKAAKGVAGTVSAEAGSYGTYRAAGAFRSATENADASASASYLNSDGFSAANKRFPGNTEDDGFETLNAAATLGWKAVDWLRLEGRVQVIDAEADYDNGGGPGADAEGAVASTEQVLTGVKADIGETDAAWRQALILNYSAMDRAFDDMFGHTEYKGENLDTEWRHDILTGSAGTLSAGASYRREEAEVATDPAISADTVGLYLQQHATLGAFDGVAGLRFDEHEEFGSELTWRAAPSYRVGTTGTRFKGSVGTGFKAPSLYQLYAPASAWGAVGNPDLDPETSLGWDTGVEQAFCGDRLLMGVTYFSSRVEDQIEFVNGYENVSRVDSDGVELYVTVNPVEALTLTAAYTYTDAQDKSTGAQVIRVPEDRATSTATYAFSPRTDVSATVLYTGAFDDRYFDSTMFTALDAQVDSAVVVNLAGRLGVTERVSLFGRIDNLFDEEYEQVYGYGTAGLSAYGGVNMTL